MVSGVYHNGKNVCLDESCATMKIEGEDYDLFKINKGINSSIFEGKAQQGADKIALKFSSYASDAPRNCKPSYRRHYIQRYKRFVREIAAMKIARDSGKNEYVVELFDDGSETLPIIINGSKKGEADFPFFSMEFADETLHEYLNNVENELLLQQKIVLFREILHCFSKLHSIDIYHRDIKPANIFRFGEIWKIGDLGLVAHREEDDSAIDTKKEKIGPIGRLSPEATNKHLGNFNIPTYSIDGVIDGKSDMYQLGLLFWYICQGEVPTGNLHLNDFSHNNDFPFLFNDILFPMLQYSKERRAMIDLEQFNSTIEPHRKELGL